MATNNKTKAAPAAANSPAHGGTPPEIQPTHLVVRSLTEGFRRAGRAWGTSEVTVPIDDITADQVEALLAEPNLVVTPMVAPDQASG